MRRSKLRFLSTLWNRKKRRLLRVLLLLGTACVAFLVLCELPFVSLLAPSAAGSGALVSSDVVSHRFALSSEDEMLERSAPVRPFVLPYRLLPSSPSSAPPPDQQWGTRRRSPSVSGLVFADFNSSASASFSELHRSARQAWEVGLRLFEELKGANLTAEDTSPAEANRDEGICPQSITMTGAELQERGRVVILPCGLTLGSHITLVARPRPAHADYDPKISSVKDANGAVMVSQFMLELQGLKTVDGEEPPRIFHFNPRLKGDWSGMPVIEQNTCYRQQWGSSQRCQGWKSKADEETVDGLSKCEKWINGDDSRSEEIKMTWWLNRLIGRKKVSLDWPYPFAEDKLFVLTINAGLEGFHVNVDGRHVTSFPYRTGFTLEDATGLSLNGDLDVDSILAASLPASHPSFASQRHLEMSAQLQAPPLPNEPVELFIGILSAGNHFAERMAVRKSWMSAVRKSPNVVARFFVALHGRMEVNSMLKKEAEFFGDIVIVPYMDNYDLVVLKTVAICEYGVRILSAKYVMKCDDDTFVNLDSVLKEVRKIPSDRSLYMGNMNYYHKPLRSGKWAVTYEEWPEEDYPPYANGPGYVVSSDIANYIVSEFEKHTLRLFKMEDVSMGMWVGKFNSSKPVEYLHNLRFCQFGCIEHYYIAHYQSPRQMLCLWDKLQAGKPECCNLR